MKKRLIICIILVLLFAELAAPVQNVFAKNTTTTTSEIKKRKKSIKGLKTSMYKGKTLKAIKKYLVPKIKSLAKGKVPGDKFTWKFENAPFYTESSDKSTAQSLMKKALKAMHDLSYLTCKAITGIYQIGALTHTIKTRWVNGRYRCALIGIRVTSWRSPYGNTCSKKKALRYYRKCRKRVKTIVSKVRAARQKGKPLTTEQKLKWIHDWLINHADYGYTKLRLHKSNKTKYKYKHLWNEYGALMRGEAVCQGFSYAFKAIVDELARQTKLKVKCQEVRASNRSGTLHSWIRVRLEDKKWYHVDLTADNERSKKRKISTKYFLCSDRKFGESTGLKWMTNYYPSTSVTRATSRKYEGKKWKRWKV